jgi:thiol-disulfide isomerase/thioredoxin
VTVSKLKALIAAAAVTGLLAGCGSSPAAEPAADAALPVAAGTGASAPAAGVPGVVVPASLKFTGRTLDGKTFDATTMAGKPTILWFWAPWCATCASEAMSISDLQDEYAGRLNILGIAGMGNNKDMHEFVSDLEVGAVPHLDDEPGKLWKKFGITEQSTYVILDKAGKVVVRSYLDDLQLTDKVKSLVA